MVRGDMADSFHMVGGEPLVRIIIMKVRNPLIGLAAEFSEIMSRCRTGCQCQVDRHARFVKSLGYYHRDIMDSGNMSQCLERGCLAV